jgi:HPt (histidine-containing phosphotransfer) domain-containing protein
MESYLTKPIRALDLKNVLTGVAELLRHGPPEAEPGAGTTEEQPEPVAPPAAGPPAVDEQVLEHLVHQLDDQDGELLRELIDSYLSDSAEQLPELVRGCEAVDATRVLKIAHSLRSSSGLLGAVHLVELLQEAEQAARGTAAELPAIALRVRIEHARVRAALLDVRDRPLQLVD